jgi:hypothetical protein
MSPIVFRMSDMEREPVTLRRPGMPASGRSSRLCFKQFRIGLTLCQVYYNRPVV